LIPRSALTPPHLPSFPTRRSSDLSNFINPEYRGAQPLACLRNPRAALAAVAGTERAGGAGRAGEKGEFTGADVLQEIERAAPDRSEEHTSELQSPDHIVCRLLLEE